MNTTPPIERHATSEHFLGLPIERFLHDYWQQHPLLVRGALPGFSSPITPDELAGLACEDGALARLVIHEAHDDRWRVESGPFEETRFSQLPERDWTLLVQDVDKWDADVAELLKHFNFLPRWRIDDIMVSYAVPEGSVGAHIDQYDVFLIQGRGQRRWQIDTQVNPPQLFREDVELKLLQSFAPSHDWVLEPGDLLYLPPGVPHHGVALDECMTLSVGMRAPSHGELVSDLADHLADGLSETARYRDAGLTVDAADGRIDSGVLRRARAALQSLQNIDDESLADWFGDFITRYRSAGDIVPPPKLPKPGVIEKDLLAGERLHLHPLARCAWREQARRAIVHIDGERFTAGMGLAQHLACAQALGVDEYASLDHDDRTLVQHLVRRGILVLSQSRD
ncbi:MAG TPA: cupin domain-containing protein [Chiayiivirga sp.]|nr:cupin domain-containing protein [Chiayiivirga sp.]